MRARRGQNLPEAERVHIGVQSAAQILCDDQFTQPCLRPRCVQWTLSDEEGLAWPCGSLCARFTH